MEATVQIEQQLIKAATIADVASILKITSGLTPRQKMSIHKSTFDSALRGIVRFVELDPVTFSYNVLTFLMHAGRHTSPEAVCDAMQAMPRPAKVG
jgi:hypothetical protein